MNNGVFEFEVAGTKRGFKFGTHALGIASDAEGCSLDVLFKRMGFPYNVKTGTKDGKDVYELRKDPPSLKTLLNVFYGAAVSYAKSKKQEVDFVDVDVSDWIDEIGLDGMMDILMKGMNQYSPKNSNSLEETREKQLA